MATVTSGVDRPASLPQSSTGVVASGNRRVSRLRTLMLSLVSAAAAFSVVAGLAAWQANVATYNDYHSIVDESSVSVDAALDHMGAAATYLETTGENRQAAASRASASWDTFNSEARVSWRNISDPAHGESNVFSAADSAATDYIQQIGAMFSYAEAGQQENASDSFLAARETMNTRLVPALGGLEAVKVEKMEATYAGAATRIDNWRTTTLWLGSILAVVLFAMLWAIRRMHYRWSWPIGMALAATVLLTLGLQAQLAGAITDARVLVREAYDSVAGVQDTAALLSQQRALDSILVFDPQNTDRYLADFDQYHVLVEQRLCGPRDCTANSFLSGDDTISTTVEEAALEEQSKLGLPHNPLVANVYFPGQAAAYERLRQTYREWLIAHETIVDVVRAGQRENATAISTGESAQAFARLKEHTDSATGIARAEFDSIWQRNYTLTGLASGFALIFPIGGTLAAWGLWQRRNELLS